MEGLASDAKEQQNRKSREIGETNRADTKKEAKAHVDQSIIWLHLIRFFLGNNMVL